MEKAGALAGHGVLVAAGEEEDAVLDGAQVHGPGHEGVVPVDDDEGPVLRYRGDDLVEVGDRVPRVVEDLAQIDQVVDAGPCLPGETLAECVEWLGGNPVHDCQPGLFPSPGLAGEGVELGVGGKDADRWLQT